MPRHYDKEVILVVDDNVITCEVIQRNLEISGYHIFTAQSVNDAIQILSRHNIDLLITDYKMPKHSGLELIKYVRDHLKDIAIIMLTGYGSINSVVSAMKEGADEYYEHLRGDLPREDLYDSFPRESERARAIAIRAELGSKDW